MMKGCGVGLTVQNGMCFTPSDWKGFMFVLSFKGVFYSTGSFQHLNDILYPRYLFRFSTRSLFVFLV